MAHAGQILTNPASAQQIVFRRTAADTGGEVLEVESIWQPGSSEPVEHYHLAPTGRLLGRRAYRPAA